MNAKTENRIRAAVILGNPWALDELRGEICSNDQEAEAFAEIVADEYRRRLRAMPREEMLELYREFYENASDANKDWLLGEIVESIEAERS
ncbi:MAG TPA: hypothetical protein VL486_03975 [Verrucomicrobiae bacterium]|nr:hypothetical protein [Verrucomicrobiae bacterium]